MTTFDQETTSESTTSEPGTPTPPTTGAPPSPPADASAEPLGVSPTLGELVGDGSQTTADFTATSAPDEMGERPDIDDTTAGGALVVDDVSSQFSFIGEAIRRVAPAPQTAGEFDCLLRVPVWETPPIFLLGGLKAEASHGSDGYDAKVTGNIGLSTSPGAGIFFDIAAQAALSAKADDPMRVAELLEQSLEILVRAAGRVPLLGSAGDAVADAVWGEGNVYKEISELGDDETVGVSKGGNLGMTVKDPTTGTAVKLKGGVVEEHELSREFGATGETSLQVKGELAVGPVAIEIGISCPTNHGQDPAGRLSVVLKGEFEVENQQQWAAAMSSGIGLLAVTAAQTAGVAETSAPQMAVGAAAAEPDLVAALHHLLAGAAMAAPGGTSGLEITAELDAASKVISLGADAVIKREIADPVTGSKAEGTQKTQIAPLTQVASLP